MRVATARSVDLLVLEAQSDSKQAKFHLVTRHIPCA